MKVINLFAGPGAGKSTTASALFAKMKREGHKVELVTEYAKELTWDQRLNVLDDSLYVLAKQNRRLSRLVGQVDFAITDSPIPISLAYGYGARGDHWFWAAVVALYHGYENINFRLLRVKPYAKYGRSQSEEEALQKDVEINRILDRLGVGYVEITGDETAEEEIYKRVIGR